MNFTPTDLATMHQALVDLRSQIEETGPCDHPVNICVCGLRNTYESLGALFYRITDKRVGFPAAPQFIDLDDPKQLAAEEASSAAEAMNNIGDIAIAMMKDMQAFRLRQLAHEADALNSSFRKGTIDD